MRRILTLTLLLGLAAHTAWSCGGYTHPEIDILSSNPQARQQAIEEMRERGPEGLQMLFAIRESKAQALAAPEIQPEQAAALTKQLAGLDEAIDAVGGAKYCTASRLYWYTDLEKAKAAAASENKPILTLRMLGKLQDEFSCANSRFFRTTLYANEDISNTLREGFILHWESVRPVPKVTIDFGDGRKLERTLTGNSIHYVLAKDGQPLDGLPGLYGPKAFAQWLTRAATLAQQFEQTAPENREPLLSAYHVVRISEIEKQWQADRQKLVSQSGQTEPASATDVAAPPAEVAMKVAAPKGRIERPVLRGLANQQYPLPGKLDALSDEEWGRLALLHVEEAELDQASVALIRSQSPAAGLAGRLAISKRVVEDPLVRLVRNFQSSIALDTVRNEYVLHRQLHHWFSNQEAGKDVRALNERVYAELFLTPSSDPWLGLMPADTYTALTNGGVVNESRAK